MAWCFLRYTQRPTPLTSPPPMPVPPSCAWTDLPPLRIVCNRHGYGTAPPSPDVVIQARYPLWSRRDARGVLIGVLGWPQFIVGAGSGQKR